MQHWTDINARHFGENDLLCTCAPSPACRFIAILVVAAAPSNFNSRVGFLPRVLQRSVDQGLRYTNPAAKLKRARVRLKRIELPTQAQFVKSVQEIRRVPFGPGLASAELVEFLAFGGFRKSEAAAATTCSRPTTGWTCCNTSEPSPTLSKRRSSG